MTRRLFNIVALAIGGALAAKQLLLSPGQPRRERRADEGRERQAEKAKWKMRALKLAVVFAALGVLGFLVAASGVIPIRASSGHWAITRWFLNFSKERSVATNTLGLDAPQLDEPWMAMKGAGHYDIGCFPCHGSPELPQPRIAQAMTPRPPYLAPEVSGWGPRELFYIVKHGIKFTGMPAWPAQRRDDEAWAMVAFLRRMPKLSAAEYRQLARGEAAANGEGAPLPNLVEPLSPPGAVMESCARCHGADGLGRGLGAYPKLAGQRPAYLFESLQSYSRGERHSGIMEPIAAGLSPEVARELADYYAALPRPAPETGVSAQATERGADIARRGVPDERIPACAACHGPGNPRQNPIYPELAGQYAEYLELQLNLFKQERRGGTAYAHIMRQVADRMTGEQMRDAALYYASLSSAIDYPARQGRQEIAEGASREQKRRSRRPGTER
jgi:cytochrome c553